VRAVDVIEKKRDGEELTKEEIEFFVRGFTNGEIPDYQAAAWAMAVVFQGMTPQETTDLTMAIARSGETIDLSEAVPVAVDKHSTGGVGDKTTLVVGPIVAACGLPVGKISGRGLGFSGGTLDKFESIPGFRTNLSRTEFLEQLRSVGLVVSGQTADLAPADGKLYALRDVTGTVPSTPLIASSIMSKKIAAGAQAIVLDVKVGEGAFMKTIQDARELATLMVSIAHRAGRRAIALLSDMNQPLGEAVGNALEVVEAIHTLEGDGPVDFREHCLVVAGHMLTLGRVVEDENVGHRKAEEKLIGGQAWGKFKEFVSAQGGDVRYVLTPELLPSAPLTEVVLSPQSGYISQVNARIVGETSVLLGAGRAKKGDSIDPAVGIVIHIKVGNKVETGQPLFTLHLRNTSQLEQVREYVLSAIRWSEKTVDPLPLFYEVIK